MNTKKIHRKCLLYRIFMIGNDFMKVVSKSKNVDRTIVFLIVILRKRPWHIFFWYLYTTKILLEDQVEKILANWMKKKSSLKKLFKLWPHKKMRSSNNLYRCSCLYALRKEFRILLIVQIPTRDFMPFTILLKTFF